MEFIRDDGGRAAAGYSGTTGDCVVRAVAIAAELPYAEVYAALTATNRAWRGRGRRKSNSVRGGVWVQGAAFKRYMIGLGFRFVATMGIGTGCTVHLHEGELPKVGRLVVSVSRHYTAVVDGDIRDLYDPRREIHHSENYRGGPVPRGWELHPDGHIIFKISRRCVYGYWVKS